VVRKREAIGAVVENGVLRKEFNMSVLTDFYNLDLDLADITEPNWRTPEADRYKIVEFFGKHAPEVVKYRTAAEIEAAKKPLGTEIIGTLGYFEHRTKQSWFDFNIDFYSDYQWVHRIIDSYLEGKTHDGTLAFLNFLLEDVKQFTTITSKKDKREYGSANAPKPINYKDYYWGNRIGTIKTTSSNPSKVRVNLGGLRFKLRNELLALLNGKIEVRKCEAEDCKNIFIPTPRGKEQRYCRMRCRKRSYGREYRKKNC
jgi:hypothetical protein